MIILTRLNGPQFAVNPDLLERVDATPDTVLTLLDGTKYVVTESLHEVIARVRDYRAGILAAAQLWPQRDPQALPQAGEPAPAVDQGLAPAVPLRRKR